MRGAAVVAVLAILGSGCSRSGESTLVVGIASSMAETGAALAAEFRQARIEFSIAGSQVLVAQVREGAPLDVVITADARTARALADMSATASEPVLIARNRLVIVVEEDNPFNITGVADLTNDELTVVLAGPEVPAGEYARQVLERAGVSLRPASLEPSVRAVLTKVRIGEADAGIVYRTDLSVGGVAGVDLPEEINPIVEYFAVPLAGADRQPLALEFVSYLTSLSAQEIIENRGFTR